MNEVFYVRRISRNEMEIDLTNGWQCRIKLTDYNSQNPTLYTYHTLFYDKNSSLFVSCGWNNIINETSITFQTLAQKTMINASDICWGKKICYLSNVFNKQVIQPYYKKYQLSLTRRFQKCAQSLNQQLFFIQPLCFLICSYYVE